MVLIFSEHFLGVWGLIIGIPIFIFLLDVLDVTSDEMEKDAGKNKVKRKKASMFDAFSSIMMFLMPYCKEKIE